MNKHSHKIQDQHGPFILKVDCPTRIDFTGGFTDVAPFRNESVAHHINLAIESRVVVNLKSRSDFEFHIVSSALGIQGEKMVPIQQDTTVPRTLVARLLQRFPLQQGLDISVYSHSPIGAGLGTSGALSTALCAGFSILQYGVRSVSDSGTLAMNAVRIGNNAGILGGCQDEFVAVFGNLNHYSFYRNTWKVLPLGLSEEKLSLLESHIMVAYPGGNRISSEIVQEVMHAYKNSDIGVRRALYALNRYALDLEGALIKLDWKELVYLTRKIGHEQRKLHPSLLDQRTKQVITELEKNARVGAKILGGGGTGACVLILCTSKHQCVVTKALLKKWGFWILPIKATNSGLRYSIERNK